MPSDDEGRGPGEVLAIVAANVAAVPIVLGFVALGGVVVATRALLGIRHAFGSGGDGRRRRRRLSTHPAGAPKPETGSVR